jgi:hypothetical protein
VEKTCLVEQIALLDKPDCSTQTKAVTPEKSIAAGGLIATVGEIVAKCLCLAYEQCCATRRRACRLANGRLLMIRTKLVLVQACRVPKKFRW